MTASENAPTAKVYVWKDLKVGDPEYDWKVGTLTWGNVLLVVHDAKTFEEAWEWLYTNYRRDTV
jgi:hypothetical protein